jgi:hypothetical protein
LAIKYYKLAISQGHESAKNLLIPAEKALEDNNQKVYNYLIKLETVPSDKAKQDEINRRFHNNLENVQFEFIISQFIFIFYLN